MGKDHEGMDLKKRITVALAAVCICVSLGSCASSKESEDETKEPLIAETAEPIAEDLRADYTEDESMRESVEALQASFAELQETNALDFTFELGNGAVTITGYTGTAEEVCVPAQMNGEPVVSIGDAAFAQNETLKKIYLPDSIETVGEGVFAGCEALTALRTPLLGANASSEQFLGYLFGAKKYADNPISVPATLAYLELGGNGKQLSDFALFDCNDLVCVTLPDSMTELGFYSMYYCSSLLALNTQHLTKVADHALDSCFSLTVLGFGPALSSIGLGALEGCMALRNLTLPFVGGSTTENTYLGYLFGAEVPDFSKGYYPTYLSNVTLLSTCTELGNYAFFECEPLLTMNLPDSLQSIGIRAFAGCVRLAEIQIPDSVTEIRENVFVGCIGLNHLTFGEGSKLTTIGINAFYTCSALKSMVLPRSLKEIPASCFAGCLQLERVDLGAVEKVGKNAFRNCQSLQALTAKANIEFEEGNDDAERLLNREE